MVVSKMSKGRRVLMVCTREIPVQSGNGRERTMAFIKGALAAQGDIEILRFYSVLERRSVRCLLFMLWAGLRGLLKAQPIPLQALLFYDQRNIHALAHAVAQFRPDTVYFDGVRSGIHGLVLRRDHIGLRLVCDFDDLMSRRMKMLLQEGQPISMGYLKKFLPNWFQRYVLNGVLSRLIQEYEWRALLGTEIRISRVCDKVVLVSSVEAEHLRRQCASVPVEVIPPYMKPQRSLHTLSSIDRFVFVGSDSFLQNRKSIEYLVALWRRLQPTTPLHIFGKQSDSYFETPSVVFRGFVPDVADAYAAGCVMLSPSFISGGVKTKILEAMSYSIVPIGTNITFEGIDADCKGLTFSLNQLEEIVRAPQLWLQHIAKEGLAVIKKVSESHSADVLSERWCRVVWPLDSNDSIKAQIGFVRI